MRSFQSWPQFEFDASANECGFDLSTLPFQAILSSKKFWNIRVRCLYIFRLNILTLMTMFVAFVVCFLFFAAHSGLQFSSVIFFFFCFALTMSLFLIRNVYLPWLKPKRKIWHKFMRKKNEMETYPSHNFMCAYEFHFPIYHKHVYAFNNHYECNGSRTHFRTNTACPRANCFTPNYTPTWIAIYVCVHILEVKALEIHLPELEYPNSTHPNTIIE